MITIQIDLELLEQARCKEVTRRNGKTARFISLNLIEKPDDRGNDGFISHYMTKEEREQGLRLPIVGNWKELRKATGSRAYQKPSDHQQSKQEGYAPQQNKSLSDEYRDQKKSDWNDSSDSVPF